VIIPNGTFIRGHNIDAPFDMWMPDKTLPA
jgi:hypothetical protein